jgi:Flp pilus assembly protein TadG
MIKNIAQRYFLKKDGSILPMAAILMPIVLGMTGFGVDVGMWLMNKRDMQSAADAAALAAAWEVVRGYEDQSVEGLTLAGLGTENYQTYPEYAALKEAIRNGYNPELGGLTISVNEDSTEVTVSIEQDENSFFSPLVFNRDISTLVSATAGLSPQTGDFCLLALDESANGAVTAVGTVDIDAQGCGIAVNSDSNRALDLTGSVVVDIADLSITGDMDVSGSVTLDYDTLDTGATRVPDPYEDLEVPSYSGCDETNFSINGGGAMSPGVYCGGVSISGSGSVTMDPGVYIMDCGNFDVTGGGDLIGVGVSIVLTCSTGDDYGNMDISSSRDIQLSAPDVDEEMAGVTIYKDRDAPSTAQCNMVVGTSEVIIDGAVYIPSDCFRIGGDSDGISLADDPCTRVIAETIEFHGNPFIGNNCDGSAAAEIEKPSVRLVI